MPSYPTDHQLLPLYHPTSVLLVGDDPEFLRSLSLALGGSYQCIWFRSPLEAIAHVHSQAGSTDGSVTPDALPPADAMEHIRDPDERALHLRASRLPQVFTDAGRFGKTSVIVSDQTLPGMSGMTMLAQIHDVPMRRVLLSASDDAPLAEGALRDGLIDAVCNKQDPALNDRLATQLQRLQLEFFRGLTGPIEPALKRADTRFLLEPALGTAFQAFVEDNAIIEYCVCMQPPGILGLDEEGNPALLIVVDDDYRQASFEIAHAERAPTELLRHLIRGDEIAVFPTTNGFYADGLAVDWRDCLWPCLPLGITDWMCAIIDEPDIASMVCGSIASYASYRRHRLS